VGGENGGWSELVVKIEVSDGECGEWIWRNNQENNRERVNACFWSRLENIRKDEN
jgi:hypothetical protein